MSTNVLAASFGNCYFASCILEDTVYVYMDVDVLDTVTYVLKWNLQYILFPNVAKNVKMVVYFRQDAHEYLTAIILHGNW